MKGEGAVGIVVCSELCTMISGRCQVLEVSPNSFGSQGMKIASWMRKEEEGRGT